MQEIKRFIIGYCRTEFLKDERKYCRCLGIKSSIAEVYQIGYIPEIGLYSILKNAGYTETDVAELNLKDVKDGFLFPAFSKNGEVDALCFKEYNASNIDIWKTDIYNHDVVFGADKIDNSKYVILVDDITSVITCSNNHISNAVSFMNSDCLNSNQIEFLKSFKNVIIAFNDDNSGQEKSIRVLKLLAENDISTFVIKLDDVDLITALNDLQGRRLIINQIKTVAGI